MTKASTLLPDWLKRSAQNYPSKRAITCGELRWTFSELDVQVNHLARQLATLDIGEQSRVGLLALNGLPYVTLVHALTRLGATLVSLNTRLTIEELCWQLQDSNATHLLNDAYFSSQASSITQRLSLPYATLTLHSDPALTNQSSLVDITGVAESDVVLRSLIDLDTIQTIMYTSGTTGQPKGVALTYGMQWWSAVGSALNLGHAPDDCWLDCLPLFHISGLSILFRSVINGIAVNLHEKFDPVAINTAIRTERVTIISVVAVTLQRMLAALDATGAEAHYPDTLRCVLLGGGPAPLPLLEDCARRGIPVVQTYGLTESCAQAVTLPPEDALRKLGSAGRPLISVQLKIVREDGHEAAAGEAGTICLQGPTITPGYINRPDATSAAIHDGWFSTGDIGYLDEDGYLYVLDRRSDLIISGGENVYPAEIESIIKTHAAVEEVGVCGIPDPQWGQVPIAFVHRRSNSNTTAEELLAYTQQRLARYKQPRAIYFVNELPRNAAGKLLRRELLSLLSQ